MHRVLFLLLLLFIYLIFIFFCTPLCREVGRMNGVVALNDMKGRRRENKVTITSILFQCVIISSLLPRLRTFSCDMLFFVGFF